MTGGQGGESPVLRRVLGVVVCPVCGAELALDGRALRCVRGHSFDLARQGYVSLLTGRPTAGTGDTAAMVRAREELLGSGHFAPVATAVAEVAGECEAHPEVVVDSGVGTGYYLASFLDRHADAVGLGLDVSKFALRRAARVHPRAAAVASDVWQTLPLRDASVDVLLDVFSPRNPAEFHRVLTAKGLLVVARPTGRHLGELREGLGLVSVDADKEERLDRGLGSRFTSVVERRVEYSVDLAPELAVSAVSMGPSAHHLDGERLAALGRAEEPISVTVSVLVTAYRPR
ncbi:methyltransferase domain-containing protein [Spiractinospora alimapuensis]|uniref:putative RNA methyltransferase n=1 Tax=Spiractinospora alimapuensis TaxID=2820884 RepID=UPI001F25DBC4|nr:methyltransferase domain-containing protein [Spiractinospora alimapuensis]QVQ50403.1 methyltransferase domain-containing protein [Spiractinospora alimapuensis]